jgi:hypothetical protein
VTGPEISRDGYRALLETALESGYALVPVEEHASEAELVCLLRHDVDADLGAALELARIERELGVRATYFVMVRSPVYNVFARRHQLLVEAIAAEGHRIGLHYDPGFPPRAGRSHEEQIAVERETLEELLDLPVESVAFHQTRLAPGATEITARDAVKANFLPGFHFVADSNKSEAVLETLDLFRERRFPRVQLLVHPMWWVGTAEDGTETLWERALLANLERMQEQLLETERGFGAPRTFTITPATRDAGPRAAGAS